MGRHPGWSRCPKMARPGSRFRPGGLVNLSRLCGAPTLDKSAGSYVWLKMHVNSDYDQTKRVALGFLHEAWVFVDGKPVFTGENLYYPHTKRLPSNGRLSLDNSSFDMPVHKGKNVIVIALANILGVGHAHYGWELEFQLAAMKGIGQPALR